MRLISLLLIFLSSAGYSQTFHLLPKKSQVHWIGTNITGGEHDGTISLAGGSLTMNNSNITGGDFKIDMKSIKSTDQKTKKNREELDDHLKNGDFFEVDKYPVATFSMTGASRGTLANQFIVKGNLRIKDISNPITFTATVVNQKNSIHAVAKIVIDRTKWNVIYQSKTVFSNMKDAVISDGIEIGLDLKFEL